MKCTTLSAVAVICLTVFCLPLIAAADDLIPLRDSDGLDVKLLVEPKLNVDVDKDFVEMKAVATSTYPSVGPAARVNIDTNLRIDLYIEGTKPKNEAGVELKGYELLYGRAPGWPPYMSLNPIPEVATLIPSADVIGEPLGSKYYTHVYGHRKITMNRVDEAGWYQSRVTFTAIEKF
jgi:hypothetical protein